MTFRIVPGNIAVIPRLIGGIGIINCLLGTVTERTGKVGLRNSIGAKPQGILLQFLIESTTFSVINVCLGILVRNLATYGLGNLVAKAMPDGGN